MKKYYLILIAIIVFCVSSCSFYRIESTDTTYDYYPSKSSVEDVVYLEELTRPYKEIGVVYVTTERRQSMDEVIYKMKYEAAILGGDAITDLQSDATGTWKKISQFTNLDNAYIHAQFSAKVVVFK